MTSRDWPWRLQRFDAQRKAARKIIDEEAYP
jgi:hypothetical protein